MAKILVALWSRPTKTKHDLNASVLGHLTRAVSKTKVMASTRGLAPATGKLRSVFIAPEFLFARPSAHRRVHDTTAVSKGMRDWIIDELAGIARGAPSMLLVPGTIVFKDALTTETVPKAIGRLQHAIAPGLVPGTKSGMQMKPYPTMEAQGAKYASMTASDGSVAVYRDQIAELTRAEKNLVLRMPPMVERSFLIKNRTYVFFDGRKMFSYGKKSNADDYLGDPAKGIFVPGKKAGVTTVDGLQVGFEICADHSVGMLKAHLAGVPLDLQIICSAEVPNDTAMFRTKRTGYTLHASSDPTHNKVFKQRDVMKPFDSDTVDEGPLDFYEIEL
ncbi:hypothetical protein C7T35_31930 [Variovorax sp. WS11]|uniref:hypothetical protein n=1 Tax=Variovorax sp. WS11 TaxID=1105204 RepID=UPI000D0E325A|nr:hypothetical protein [Variovorax sp. WS11]NDZ15927.1 hypothetical protein [Variovorax sp. WS11]PSL80522.1 hypothetical protein C7T35_31930 [Variovorax sp. WS11]